jgi:hypothetical protein
VKLPISVIRRDFQPEEYMLDVKVEELVLALLRGDVFPPVVVRYDGESYWLQDGSTALQQWCTSGARKLRLRSFLARWLTSRLTLTE